MKINDYINRIKGLNACGSAIEAALQYETSQAMWDDCKRGDWMLWLIGKLYGDPGSEKRKRLVLAACKCARLALKHVPQNEGRPLKAIETAEGWAKGEGDITLGDVRAAADAAYDAADAAYDAADAAAAAAYAAYDAADAYDAARKETLAKCAHIVREYYPNVDDLFEGD